MVIPEFVLRLTVGPALYKALEPYRITEEQMPFAYQHANPDARFNHGDWALCKDTPRISCARRVNLPFRVAEGAFEKKWEQFDPEYPMSPDHESRFLDDGTFQVLTDRGGYGLVKYEAFIGGAWVPVFKKYTRAFNIFGTRYRLSWYVGLHQDNHWADLMCWIEPFAMSFVKEV